MTDVSGDVGFDRLTKLAALICNLPYSLLILFDENGKGIIQGNNFDFGSSFNDSDLLDYIIQSRSFVEINNLSNDHRFAARLVDSEGFLFHFFAGYPLIDNNGCIQGVLCVLDLVPNKLTEHQHTALKILSEEVCSKITVQKVSEENVSVSENKFRKTFYHAATGMFVSDPKTGVFLEVNEALSRITGYVKDDLIGIKYSEIIHREDLTHLERYLRFLISGKIPSIHTHKRLVTKSGETVWVEMVACLIKDDHGIPLNVIGQVQNITSRVNAERKLILSEEKHRVFFENSQGLMCTHNLSGKFITVNPAGAKLLGYTVDELLTMTLFDIVDIRYVDMVSQYLQQVETAGQYKGLMQLNQKDGQSKTWMYNNVLAESINGSKYVIGNAVDLTERIITEKNLHKAKQLADSQAHAKDVFLANMSHEIRTPINAITGFANLLNETELDKDQAQYVTNINTAGENLMGIINDILDFSKIESGYISIESIPFSLKEVLDSVLSVLGQKAIEKKLKFSYALDSNVPDDVIGDPVRLNQILINLANNAIKFTNDGVVKIKVVADMDEIESCRIKFSITDTGIGIDEAKLNSIFSRFTQADTDTTRKYGGTGLGLSICKSLIELQSGTIWVESTKGAGSIFHFVLPYKKDASQRSLVVTKHNKLFSTRRLKVLLVEDNLLNQVLGMKVLENFNFLPELASNGSIAIEMIEKEHYDVILMDLQMPEMDGYQATEIIRNKLKNRTPIIAMTAHSLVGEKDKCLAIGMNDYIPKPFKQDEVFNKIIYYADVKPMLVTDGDLSPYQQQVL